MAGEAILVVDDEPTYLRLMRALLHVDGYEVRTAADAEQALEVLKTFRPQLTLMDIQLPRMNGLDLTRRLKANPATSELTIVAFSGWASPDAEQEAFDAGCDGYIAKPVAPDILKQLVAKYLKRAQAKAAEQV
jgi:CheY-like chemotaxis protein